MSSSAAAFLWVTAAATLCWPSWLATAAEPVDRAVTPAVATERRSPVETFRKLLAMTPAERDQFLTNYPGQTRQRIREKLEEYQILPPPIAESRLQTTELRWYLIPLLKADPTNRTARMQFIPEHYRALIDARLSEWDILPPELKDEIMEYETVMELFIGRDAQVQSPVDTHGLTRAQISEQERRLAQWQALPAEQRKQMHSRFEKYLRLNDEEQQKILDALSEPDRRAAERLVNPIGKQPRAQQQRYILAVQKLSDMSAAERQQFRLGAERWQQMSEGERQAWRDLIKIIPPGAPIPVPGGGFSPARTNPVSAPER